jgi:hypothetical protein
LGASPIGPRPQFASVSANLRDIPNWLTDVLNSERDEQLFIAWCLVVLCIVALGAEAPEAEKDALKVSLVRRLGLLAPVCVLAFFLAPTSYDWIWPINARFPYLALIFLIPILPRVPRRWQVVLGTGATLITLLTVHAMGTAFREFQDEVGELDRAIASIPPGRKVCGLIWDRYSRNIKFAPFLHSVAWYQVRRGGAVMFSFADFPQSPIRFRENNRPPRVPPRWEWQPENLRPELDLEFYDYVLTRGGPGRIAVTPEWRRSFESGAWRVFERVAR